jgi:S-adenosylmethionine synthetase
MPAPIMYAHKLGRALTKIRKSGKVAWLRPDAKIAGLRPLRERPAGGNHQRRHLHPTRARREAQDHRGILHRRSHQKGFTEAPAHQEDAILINPTGRFVVGGPQGDTGLTGRKIIVDSYGGMGRHGGGAFSGKDPSKVDRSAAYMGRYVAKNIVAAGIATSAEIQFAYAIGYPDPVSVCASTPSARRDGLTMSSRKAVREVFSFKPANIIKQLNLLRPIYSKTTNYGHFGKNDPGYHLGKNRQGQGPETGLEIEL